MADGCGCGEVDDLKILQVPENVHNGIDVRGLGQLKFTVSYEGVKKVFTGQIVPYSAPSINAEANPVREVGELVDFTWNLNIIAGSEAIISRAIIPDDYDITVPVSISVVDEVLNVRGFKTLYTINVVDDNNITTSRILGINFYNKVYRGYSYKDGVNQLFTEADILALANSSLASTIKSVYGGSQSYVVPVSALQQYIYWVYEAGTEAISAIKLSDLPFPIVQLPSVIVTNAQGVDVTYVVIRSANKFSNGTLQLEML